MFIICFELSTAIFNSFLVFKTELFHQSLFWTKQVHCQHTCPKILILCKLNFFFRKLKNAFAFSIMSSHRDGTGGCNPSSWNTRIVLSHITSTMAADGLVTQGADSTQPFTGTVITKFLVSSHYQYFWPSTSLSTLYVNILKSEQNGCQLPDKIFIWTFVLWLKFYFFYLFYVYPLGFNWH